MSSRASVLVALLWCVALLALIVVGVLHTSRLDLRVAKNYGDTIQAHYLALAGIEKASGSVVLTGLRPAKRKKFVICKSVRGALMSSG